MVDGRDGETSFAAKRVSMKNKPQFALRLLLRTALAACLVGLAAGACNSYRPSLPEAPSQPAQQSPTEPLRRMPDLVIRSVTVLNDSPDGCPIPDQKPRTIVQIENIGNAPAGQFVVKLNNSQQLVHNGLAAGDTLAISFPGYDSFPLIAVDASSLVVEFNETNNSYYRGLALPTPDPACASTPTPQVALQEAKFVFEGHTAAALSVAFSPDGRTVASGSVDDSVRLWSITQARLARVIQEHPFPIWRLKYAPNGATLYSGSTDGVIRAWQASTGRLARAFEGHVGRITGLDVSKDGRRLASSAEDFTVRIWGLPNGVVEQVIDEGMAGVTGVHFTPDSQAVVWGEADGTLRIRSLRGKWMQVMKQSTHAVTSLDLTADGKLIAAGYANGLIRIWGATDGALLQTLRESQAAVTALAFSPDGKWLISASQDRTLKVWQLTGSQVLSLPARILTGHAGAVNCVAFSPDGESIASGSDDSTVRIWELPPE